MVAVKKKPGPRRGRPASPAVKAVLKANGQARHDIVHEMRPKAPRQPILVPMPTWAKEDWKDEAAVAQETFPPMDQEHWTFENVAEFVRVWMRDPDAQTK